MMFACWPGRSRLQNLPTTTSNASRFHIAGARGAILSYRERAEITSIPQSSGRIRGMYLTALSCTQPSSAFVTMTTRPIFFILLRVCAMQSEATTSDAQCRVASTVFLRQPDLVSQVVGMIVSSQSSTKSVAMGAAGRAARAAAGSSSSAGGLPLPDAVERSERQSSSSGCWAEPSGRQHRASRTASRALAEGLPAERAREAAL
mmetsp:Transcript_48466/g.140378  ORF Transcript_48466/g.140378 Transcript_48466/m.140378 type:complete len:204 (+) Transcript_48466:189-800(+)